eukprot:1154330-Pelagomonas_calceolata.AAC.4
METRAVVFTFKPAVFTTQAHPLLSCLLLRLFWVQDVAVMERLMAHDGLWWRPKQVYQKPQATCNSQQPRNNTTRESASTGT